MGELVNLEDEVFDPDDFLDENLNPPTVEELLDNINYDFKNYIPSEEAFEFFNFIRLVLGEEPENTNSITQYFMMDIVFGNISRDVLPYSKDISERVTLNDAFFAVLCHREFSKSTLLGVFLPLFIAYKGTLPKRGLVGYGIYVGDSIENNVKTTFNSIKVVFLDSEFLCEHFESWAFTERTMVLVRKKRADLTEKQNRKMKRTFSFSGFGAQTGVRGQRSGLTRPQFAIIDDTVKSAKDAASDTILESIDLTIYNDVISGLHGASSFALLIGTPYNKKDPVYSAIESGGATPIVFPIAESIKPGMKAHEFKGSWLSRHSYRNVMKKFYSAIASKKKASFMQEKMLRIISEENKLIDINAICTFENQQVWSDVSKYSFYITTDLTTTGNKASNYAAIGLWAVDVTGRWLLMKAAMRKMDVDDQYDIIFDHVSSLQDRMRFPSVGVEIDGNQSLHVYALKLLMNDRKVWFSFAKQIGKNIDTKQVGISSKKSETSKLDRIKLTVPKFDNGKILFSTEVVSSPEGKEILEQLDLITNEAILSKYDDGIDMVSQMALVDVVLPQDLSESDQKPPIQEYDDTYDEYSADESSEDYSDSEAYSV